MIPDENIEAAKEEFKDFIFARFHGDSPSMGHVIGVVNVIWARTGPRIIVHHISSGTFLLRVCNTRTKEFILSRNLWSIAGFPMFVAPWSPEFNPEEPPLTSAVVPVEFRDVPYLLFNKESLSRLATAVGTPVALSPETERKETLEVAKVYIRVNLLSDLPSRVISGFSNGREALISISYPWLPQKCFECGNFGHDSRKCPTNSYLHASGRQKCTPSPPPVTPRKRRSRPGRSRARRAKSIRNGDSLMTLEDGEIPTKGCDPPEVNDPALAQAKVVEVGKSKEDAPKNLIDVETGCSVTKNLVHPSKELRDDVVCPKFEQGNNVKTRIEPNGGKGQKRVLSIDKVAPVIGDQDALQQDAAFGSNGESDEAPFFLVSYKKSGRKATKKTLINTIMFFTWNIRGLNNARCHTMTNDWINIHRPLFGAFTETHINRINAGRISRAIPVGWNFLGNFDHHETARLVVVWDPSVSVVFYQVSAQAMTCGFFIPADNTSITVTFVYGFSQVESRVQLWEELVHLNDTTPVSRCPWAVVGDFNQILRHTQHSSHLVDDVDISGMEDFNLALQGADLFEAQSKGLTFSWWNNQDGNPISKKIDHALINQAWSNAFPDSYSDFLDPDQSDHAVCLFRFKLVRALKGLKPVLRNLNKRYYSGITARVKEQSKKLAALQRQLLTSPSADVAREEHAEREKWKTLKTAEEKYFYQRSRVKWLDLGDRNTAFFHRIVAQRVTRNHIHFLKDNSDRMLTSAMDIKSHSAEYFQGILGNTDLSESPVTVTQLQALLPFRCSDSQVLNLQKVTTAEEIRDTLFALPLSKSPGPDGYFVEFFRASWATVGKDVIASVSEFFRNRRLLRDINNTAISLIPKNPEGCKLSEYRPISCCNTTYKVIAKLIANRLKPVLDDCISSNQAAFLKGRSLGENVLLVSELIRNYQKSSCPNSCMLKVYLRKDFDTVCWDFILKVLEAQGKKGLRQGDAMSPYLFIMVMEVLSKLLENAVDNDLVRLHPQCENPRITHLLFADDLLVFSDGSKHSLDGIKQVMLEFKEICGLDMNVDKTEIFFGGYGDAEAADLSAYSGIKIGTFPTRYLG
ncbi:uncharacterized protein LOC112085166 [Eutrema salsugineum]|uniref:uncharacterized protein LOC112085166 n=1 Tax=Eutrema salsugineum TaxID=72664 RepID=UPI000CECFDCB|nr:uncharacterized protein LOC112085166 [Eutrema salsugineum]